MNRKLKVIQYGVGFIGSEIIKTALKKKGLEFVGAIDVINVGKDLDEVLKIGKKLDVKISNDAEIELSKHKPDIILHSTSSYLKDVYPQLVGCIEAGANVISTCEELSYPYLKHPDLSKKIDNLAKEHQVTVLGTGINPGFLMDVLPITLTSVCQDVKRVKVTRQIDAGKRRMQFQKKIGAGLTVDDFGKKISEKTITGHVGLAESIGMIADTLGWKLSKIDLGTPEPATAQFYVDSLHAKVQPGQVAGLRQVAHGLIGREKIVTFDFRAYLGAAEEFDKIEIVGKPPVNQKISPCIHGDTATAAMVVNAIPRVVRGRRGLVTMRDLPVPACVLGDVSESIKE
mgnify:CR=1 FL=1